MGARPTAQHRVVVSNGALSNGQIVITAGGYNTPSWANQYDAAGNVVVRNTINADAYTANGGTPYTKSYSAGDTMTQRLVYDARNEQVEIDYATDLTQGESSLGVQQRMTYDADGRQVGNNTYSRNDAVVAVYGTQDKPYGYTYVPDGGWLQSGQAMAYNADGAVTEQVSFQAPYRNWIQIANSWINGNPLPNGGQEAVPSVTGDGPLVVNSTTTYTAFDHAGNVTAYTYAQNPPSSGGGRAFGAHYTVSYIKKDGYLEHSTSGTATVEGYVPATDTSYYDAFGRRTAVSQTSQGVSGAKSDTRLFAYDTRGEILERRRGTVSDDTFTAYSDSTIDHYAYVDGQQVSALDEGGGIHVLGSLTGFSSGDSSRGYVVQAGDTLAGIAQAVYGNSQYGYLVAEANGLGGDGDLVVGQTITLPSITTSSNAANTFKPYDPHALVGSTTPNLPLAPPPPPHCNVLAAIVVIAVAIVVTYFTAGAASTYFSSYIVGGAIGGAAGSAASQLAGNAMGTQHGFDWGQVFVGAVGGAIGGAVASKLSGVSAFNSGATLEANGLNIYGNAVVGAADYTGTYGAEKLVNEPAHFSWAGLVADAAGSVAAAAVGPTGSEQKAGITGKTYAKTVGAKALQDVVQREASVSLGDHHVQSWQQIAEDVFGNAFGNAAVAGINAYGAGQASSTATPAYDPESDPLLRNAREYREEMAFDQSAQEYLDDSPVLLADTSKPTSPLSFFGGDETRSTDAPLSSAAGASPPKGWVFSYQDNIRTSADGDQSETLGLSIAYYGSDGKPVFNFSWSGGASYSPSMWGDTALRADPTFPSLDVKTLDTVTVTASPADLAAAQEPSSFERLNGQSFDLSSVDVQLMDVLPGSARWTTLMQQKASQGLSSRDPYRVSQGELAALQLRIGEQVEEARFNGGRPMPTVKAWDPSLEPEVFMARLGALESNPIAGGVWGIAKYSGASDRGADILATTAGAGFAVLSAAGAVRGTGGAAGGGLENARVTQEVAALRRIANNPVGSDLTFRNPYSILLRQAEDISTAKSSHSIIPRDLNESALWNRVLADPSAGTPLPSLARDQRFARSAGFMKMQATHLLPDGSSISIHYQYNSITLRPYDIKIVTPQRSLLQPGASFYGD